MHLKDGIIIKHIEDEYLLLDSGIEPPIFNGLIKLNETGKCIIELLQTKDMNEEELYLALKAQYELNKEDYQKGVVPFLERLKATNILR